MSSFTLVTGGYDTTIRFFDASNQAMVHTIQFCDQQVLRLAFSSDRPVLHSSPLFLIAGGSPSVAVYNVTTAHIPPTLFQIYQRHTEAITAVGFEPRHTAFCFSASEDGTLHTWIPELTAHAHHHAQVQDPTHSGTSPDPFQHPMAAGAYLSDGSPRFSSVPCIMRNTGPNGLVPIHDAVYYPPSDLFFTADLMGRLRIWHHLRAAPTAMVIPHPSKRNLQCLELSHNYSTLVAANFSGYVFIYDVQKLLKEPTSAVPITFRAYESYIPRVRLSMSGALLVCTTCTGTIKVFRMVDITACQTPRQPETDIRTPVAENQASSLDDPLSIAPTREFTGHRGWIWDAAFVEDREDYLFTCSSNMQVMLWALHDIQNSTPYPGHHKGVVCLAVRERMTPDINSEQFGPSTQPENIASETSSQNVSVVLDSPPDSQANLASSD